MNPPFSAVANVDGRTTEATARHLRSSLARLAPGGRLVILDLAGVSAETLAHALSLPAYEAALTARGLGPA